MNVLRTSMLMCVVAVLAAAGSLRAETTVTIKGSHLCCPLCIKAVDAAIADVDGATAKADKDTKTITVTADSDEAAQKAVDALAKTGFHGSTDNDKIGFKDDSGAEAGNVKRVEVTGVHNCCGGCNNTIKKAVATVDGVEANTVKPKASSFVVEGNFDAADLVKALNDAGFHVKLKK